MSANSGTDASLRDLARELGGLGPISVFFTIGESD